MELWNNPKFKPVFIISILVILSVFTLWIRLIPLFNLGNQDILNIVGSDDPLYNLRQTEQLLVNFPMYAWYDFMTLFPFGTGIYWGPLTTYIQAAACMIAGASMRQDVIRVALLIPPLMAVAMVPLMYLIGRTIADWKTGLFAALMISVVSGQYYFRSFYGYLDHHMGEVLFSTLFCFLYIAALISAKKSDLSITKPDFTIWKGSLLFSVLAGVAYLLGHMIMPTMIVFAMIVGIFTLFQYIFDFYRGQKSDYLVLANTAIFVVASIGVALFGIKYEGIELSTYSAGHIYAFGLLIGGTMLLYALAHLLKGKNAHYYPGSLLVLGILFFASLAFAAPVFFSQVASNLAAFFGQAPVTTTIQEARAWGILEAWVAFSYGLILMIGGVIVLLARNIRDEQPHQIFVLIWSLIMLVSAWQHVRYEYYLAVNIALLSAVCLSSAWDIGARTTLEKARTLISTETGKSEGSTGKVPEKRGKIAKTEAKPGKKHKSVSRRSALPPIILCIGVTILSLLFIYSSVSHSMLSANYAIRMNDDWKESLEWMGSHTPDTGVDYYKIYDEKTYKYPPNAYGVMSWWDYGHMITYIAKRIPNANPFQRGVAGPIGAATYFMLPSEEAANAILDTLTTRYVITDIEMDAGKFWAMATWYNTTAGTEPYMNLYAIPDQNDPLRYNKAEGYDQNYYLTMVSRLHNFDGSMVEPTRVFYIQYQETPLGSTIIPVITQAVPMNALEAKAAVESFNANAKRGEHADILSTTVFFPKETVPALKHYRLVHESPTDVVNDKSLDVRYVKVFEYVKGARIKGNGIIEVPVVTNTGRTFTYRQASENGEFIVPYSTSGSDSEVRATGKYRIVGATTQYEAPEDAVREGRTIN